MRIKNQRTLLSSLAVIAVFAVFSAPAPAWGGEGVFELFGGTVFVQGDVDLRCNGNVIVCTPEGASGNIRQKHGFDGDTPTFGLGGGYRFSDKLALLGTVNWVDGDDTFGEPVAGSKLELDILYFDFSARYSPKGGPVYLLGGIGFADIRAELLIGRPRPRNDDQRFTAHGGLGGEFDFGRGKYFLAQAKLRYIDSTVYDDIDVEVIVGLGFRFGG